MFASVPVCLIVMLTIHTPSVSSLEVSRSDSSHLQILIIAYQNREVTFACPASTSMACIHALVTVVADVQTAAVRSVTLNRNPQEVDYSYISIFTQHG